MSRVWFGQPGLIVARNLRHCVRWRASSSFASFGVLGVYVQFMRDMYLVEVIKNDVGER